VRKCHRARLTTEALHSYSRQVRLDIYSSRLYFNFGATSSNMSAQNFGDDQSTTQAGQPAGAGMQDGEPTSSNNPNGQVEAHGNGTAGPNQILLPSITVPSGGGAIKGMNEVFDVDLVTGTASLKIPVPLTQCPRWGTPNLTLAYDSGARNGVMGLGWELLGIPVVERKTSNGLPVYNDDLDSFMVGGEELIPVFDVLENGGFKKESNGMYAFKERRVDNYTIRQYCYRIQQNVERIERWTSVKDTADVHWRIISSENETQIFGRSSAARVSSEGRTFQWLLCESYDCHGGSQLVEWKTENGANVDRALSNEVRRTDESRASSKLLKRIKYGNAKPNRTDDWELILPSLDTHWLFEVVFDYGDHDPVAPKHDDDSQLSWAVRKDPFSIYTPGFEIRTYRLCRRILMFHNMSELGQGSTLISSLDLEYNETPFISYLTRATRVGYKVGDKGNIFQKRCPPIEFEYTQVPGVEQLQNLMLKSLDSDSMRQLPIGSVGDYRWIDLYGDGTTGVLSQGQDAWYYRRNLSIVAEESVSRGGDTKQSEARVHAKLGPPVELPVRPHINIQDASITSSLVDLNGDGLIDLMVASGSIHGFYRGSHDPTSGAYVWKPFEPFHTWPNFNLQDANLGMIDLTGNGLADILITLDDRLVWYESCGLHGYGPPHELALSINEERGPRVLLSDSTHSIMLADMSGDGLVDIVRVRNSEICYWPNLGYGRFGEKVAMDNSPVFDSDESYDHKRLLLCDVDGSGLNDILYFHSSSATLFNNEAGNRWSDGIVLHSAIPIFDTLTRVSAADILGTGTTCLVYSNVGPAVDFDSTRSLQYVDLMNGIKPHLLANWKDNRGSTTTIDYRPSTQYYLRDEEEGAPWVTRLPFPIQCVDRIVSHDLVNKRAFTHQYRYHHGYYDGKEREFRGFGMVEEWDGEEFATLSKLLGDNADKHDEALHTSPIHTKSWFHVGRFNDLPVMRSSYAPNFHGLSEVESGPKDLFLADFTGTDYTEEELREATRSLKGSKLHGEEYDLSISDSDPIAIDDTGNSVRMLQPRGQNKHAVFQVFEHETFTTHYEGDIKDPMSSQELTLKVDHYGNVLKSVHIAYGRQNRVDQDIPPDERKNQERTSIVYKDNAYTKPVDLDLEFLVPHPTAERQFELSMIAIGTGSRYTYRDFAGVGDFSPIDQMKTLGYYDTSTTDPGKRLIAHHEIRYRSNDLQVLGPGLIGSLALPGKTYRLCLTQDMIDLYKDGGLDVGLSEEALTNAGYSQLDGGALPPDKGAAWWIPSPTVSYSADAASKPSVVDELKEARRSFFRPHALIDPFGAVTQTTYDTYCLLSKSTTDPMHNQILAEHDYRFLCPKSITDPNKNLTKYAWDILGRLVGIAEMGKPESILDSMDGFVPDLTSSETEDYFAQPLTNGSRLLAGATTRYIVDDDAFMRAGKPISASKISAVNHGQLQPRPVELRIEYQDAHGNVVQEKSPSQNKRWLTSGWTVINNKGLPVAEFEPFYDDSSAFAADAQNGHCSLTFYDARERPIAKLYPDQTWTKTVYENWRMLNYDRNDLTDVSAAEDSRIGLAVKQLPVSVYSPTWYEQRINGTLGTDEKTAAEKAKVHQNTPGVVYVDPMGNDFLHVKNTGSSLIRSLVLHDVQGHVISEVDRGKRVITKCKTDMDGRTLLYESMDHVPTKTFLDVSGGVITEWKGRDIKKTVVYDVLRRPVRAILNMTDEPEAWVMKTMYGDEPGVKLAQENNLRGRIFQQYDQSGCRTQCKYNMLGECLLAKQQLAQNYKTTLNWNGDVEFAGEEYEFSWEFDALRRLVTRTTHGGSVTAYEYDEGGLLFSVKTQSPGQSPITAVSRIEYDPYQREIFRVQDQTDTTTISSYDPRSQHLVRKSIRTGKKTQQDMEYVYDPEGNLISQRDGADKDIFFRNGKVEPLTEYTYDSTYRLTGTKGREHMGQTRGGPPSEGFPDYLKSMDKFFSPSDSSAVARYTETYEYDEASNMRKLEHTRHDSSASTWTKTFLYESPSLLQAGEMNNRLTGTRFGSSPPTTYKYDEHGNMVSMPGLTVAKWDFQNQLRGSSSQIVNNGTPDMVW
jgi:YD repeat-containing protein